MSLIANVHRKVAHHLNGCQALAQTTLATLQAMELADLLIFRLKLKNLITKIHPSLLSQFSNLQSPHKHGTRSDTQAAE